MASRRRGALHRRYGHARYTVEFTGRTRGAIGIFHPMRVTIEAPTAEEAKAKIRDEYEMGPVTKGSKRGQYYLRVKGRRR